MKNITQFAIAFLFIQAFILQNTIAQELFDGVLYQPIPIPFFDSTIVSQDHRNKDYYGIRYHSESGNEIISDSTYFWSETRGQLESHFEAQSTSNEAINSSRYFTELEYNGPVDKYPQRTTVKLFMTFLDDNNSEQYFVGTGALIGHRSVITAGHCIYNAEYGWAKTIIAVPAYENGHEPFGRAHSIYLSSWTGWTENQNYDWDMGLITLDKSIGNCTDWLGLMWDNDDNFFRNNTFHNFSYPAANPFDGQYMFYHRGIYDEVTTHILRHYNLGYGGMSGSAHYYKDGNVRYVTGIHSHSNSSSSGIIRINQTKFESMIKTMNEFGQGNPCSGIINKTKSLSETVISIYPNPAYGFITIDTELDFDKIIIFDANGRIVKNTQSISQIDLRDLNTGIYSIQFLSEKISVIKKIAITR